MFKESKLLYGMKEGFFYGFIKFLLNVVICIMIVFLSFKKDYILSNFLL